MDSNMLNDAKELFSGKFTDEVSAKLGESSDGVKKAIAAIIPTIFGGIANKVSNEPSFLSTVVSEAKNIFTNHSLDDLSGFITGDNKNTEATQAGSFLFDVFGGKLHGIIDKVAGHSGLKTENVRKLFDTVQIGALGSIGKHLSNEGGSGAAVSEFLSENKAGFLSAIPASLGFGSLLSGVHEVTPEAPHTQAAHSDAHYHQHQEADPAKGENRFFIPAILTIIIFGLIIWLFRGCWGNEKQHDHPTNYPETTTVSSAPSTADVAESAGKLDETTGNYIYNTGELTSIDLPNGTKIEGVGQNSTENKLIQFLSNPNVSVDTVDKTKGWISFDRLYFKSSSSELTNESKNQLNNISLILKAFPNAAIKLGGYTDNSGTAEGNLSLSGQRAQVARDAIIAKGIDAQRLEAEGYGQEHPIASNETAEGKAQNRRIDLRVIRK